MKITREGGQEAVVSAYLRWRFLMVEYCTGFGKGKAALNAVSRAAKEVVGTKSKGLIIVHSEPARDFTWPAEITKWAPDLGEYSDYKIVCYAGIANMQGSTYDWVIADECHYLTPHNELFFKGNICHSIILMTGLLPDDEVKVNIIKRLSNRRILTITLDQAIENNILNDYQIVVWNMKLTPEEWQKYLELCKMVDWATSKGNITLQEIKRGDRMRFIYTLHSKYQAAAYVRDQLRSAGRRMFIFTCSKDIANRLSAYRYYEGTGNHDFIDFKDGNIDEVASIKMIQEGANIDNVDAALVEQLNAKPLNFMQKLGRLMRLKVGMLARIHIICAYETYDASWVQKALKEANPKKIVYKDLPRSYFEHYT